MHRVPQPAGVSTTGPVHPSHWNAMPEACFAALWLVVCLAGSYLAMSYDFRPGRLGSATVSWPSESSLTRSSESPTIVAFLHPRCPCTRATVDQLLAAVAAHPGARVLVPMFTPPGPADEQKWLNGDYAQAIRAAIPAASILPDRGGAEARRFGALTSGTTLVYDSAGRELFRGGITDRRGGHEDNPGLRRFAAALRGYADASRGEPSPVFGCPLVDEHAREPRGQDAQIARTAR